MQDKNLAPPARATKYIPDSVFPKTRTDHRRRHVQQRARATNTPSVWSRGRSNRSKCPLKALTLRSIRLLTGLRVYPRERLRDESPGVCAQLVVGVVLERVSN